MTATDCLASKESRALSSTWHSGHLGHLGFCISSAASLSASRSAQHLYMSIVLYSCYSNHDLC